MLDQRNEDGVFLTWIKPVGESNDVDSVVNANVLLYLGDRPETVGCAEFLNQVVGTNTEAHSYWYYTSDAALYHAMSRAFHSGARSLTPSVKSIAARIRMAPPENELICALGLSSLVYLGCVENHALRSGLSYLLDHQRENGSWRRLPFCCGPEPPASRAAWFGSEELTACLCLEALAQLRRVGIRDTD
jgi:hypothetical protein